MAHIQGRVWGEQMAPASAISKCMKHYENMPEEMNWCTQGVRNAK